LVLIILAAEVIKEKAKPATEKKGLIYFNNQIIIIIPCKNDNAKLTFSIYFDNFRCWNN